MRQIAEGTMPLVGFLDGVVAQIQQLVRSGRAVGALKVPSVRPCPAPGCIVALRRRDGKSRPLPRSIFGTRRDRILANHSQRVYPFMLTASRANPPPGRLR
jgi:hypothetical protein